jgi:ubiquinone/menaquinone biosynthesis C-methylase UbiE
VGGGRRPDFPRLKTGDVALNISPRARPHVQGDIARAPFADNSFTEVYFELVPFTAVAGDRVGAIPETARVLTPGGRLVIHTGSGVDLTVLVPALRAAGFRFVRVTNRGYLRITGRLAGPHETRVQSL